MDPTIFKFGHADCCKPECKSKVTNRMAECGDIATFLITRQGSEMDPTVFKFGCADCCKHGCKSKITNRMANSVDPVEMTCY